MRSLSWRVPVLLSVIGWITSVSYLLAGPAVAQTVRTFDSGVTITVDPHLALEKVVEPEHPPASISLRGEVSGSVQVGVYIRPDGAVAQARAVKAADPSLVMMAEKAVKQWQYDPASLKDRNPTQTLVIVDFPPPAPHNSGKRLMESTLYRVTTRAMEGNWCHPTLPGIQATINIVWHVTAEEDLTGRSPGYQRHLRDIWNEVAKHCTSMAVAHIANYVAGVRLIENDSNEVAEAVQLQPFVREEPINSILIIKDANDKFEVREADRYKPLYPNLETARAQRKTSTIVTLTGPPRLSIGTD